MKKFDLEKKILILTSKYTIDEEEQKEIIHSIQTESVHWLEFAKYALYHKTFTLCFYNILTLLPDLYLPNYLSDTIKATTAFIQQKETLYLDALLHIKNAFQKRNVPLYPVKGAMLIPEIYGLRGLRYVSDLDIIIRKKDIGEVHAIMTELGYVQGDYDPITDSIKPVSRAEQLKWILSMSNLYCFLKKTSNNQFPVIEIDFRYSLDDTLETGFVDTLLDRVVLGKPISVSYPLIHLCTHFYNEAKHTINIYYHTDLNIIKLCDIRELMLFHHFSEGDMEELLALSKKYHYEKAVYYTFFYLNQIYHEECFAMVLNKMSASDDTVLQTFGENTGNENLTFQKDFWDRFFSCGNADELETKPKILEKVEMDCEHG